ncbi:MarR family winged helix-turn-helix transcriptional regulator [Rubrivivax albus]|uniref:MarR family winged helix-turn-helix transcriptional regulator n=1 Tax=Rubrivivax albus TaxID=2499835 RepID=UPI001E3C865D|nr:MarR family transcriptional regulator [Rubrivivax albus]
MTLSLRHPRSLDDLLNYRLLQLHALSGAPVIRLLEGRYGIARREWRLIGLLAARGELSPSALADEAQLDRPRTSRAIGALVAKGLLARVPLPGDARQARVALTAAGRQLHDELFPQVAAINQAVLQAVDDRAIGQLDQLLTALTARARTLNAELVQDVRADRRAGGSRRVRPQR